MTHRGLLVQIVGAVSFVIASVAVAADGSQDARATNSQSASSTDSSQSATPANASQIGQLQQVIVTATKHAEPLQDVPVAITVLRADALVQNHDVDLEDYYATVPGLSLTSLGNGQTGVTMRGISAGIAGNPTVGITIDDVPIGATDTAIINGNDYIPDLDPADLQSIDFLKGPQGTLYGASSIGGLIRYVTAVPDFTSTSGHVQIDGSAIPGHGEGYGIQAGANIPLIPDTLAIRVSGFDRQDPGYVDNPSLGLDNVNSDKVYGAHLDALLQATQNFSVRLLAFIQRTQGYGDSFVDTNYLYQPNFGDLNQPSIPNTGHYSMAWQMYSAVLKYHSDLFDVTSISAFSKLVPYQSQDFTPVFGPYSEDFFAVGGAAERYVNTNNKMSEEVRLSSPTGSKLQWLVGGFFTHESNGPALGQFFATNLETGAQVGALLNYAFNSTYQEYAGFANLTWHFADRFDLQVGGRDSHNTQTYYQDVTGALNGPASILTTGAKESSFTYLVTPQYHISDSTMTYISVASGFEAGGPNSPEFPTPQIPLTYAPSKTVNYEWGIKSTLLQRRLLIDADIFYINWSNVQLTGVEPVVGTTYTFNGGKAKSQGIEFQTDFIPVEGLKLSATAAYTDATLTNTPGQGFPGVSGDPLPFSSKYNASLSADEQFNITGSLEGFVGATAAYVGSRYEGFPATLGEAQPRIPSYAYGDLRTGIVTHGFTVTAFLKNVTNERGILNTTQLTGTTATSGIWQTVYMVPRTVGLSIAKTF